MIPSHSTRAEARTAPGSLGSRSSASEEPSAGYLPAAAVLVENFRHFDTSDTTAGRVLRGLRHEL
ncbi:MULTISPECIES: hypothetical protein [Streptomyces]|uniref:Uncharacterized protein n=1 Tax=Streptomyces venezuelae TaxID=54571 RepID=A0A5P2AKD0_STRVZ|nr:hypothetical protein [Streptomyces venezuelae]QES18652.1 hypothetical protein DEJ46_05770 [Streptomyces venezuelae]